MSYGLKNSDLEALNTYEDGYLRTGPRGGSRNYFLRRFVLRRIVGPKVCGNESTGLDFDAKKDLIQKYSILAEISTSEVKIDLSKP